MEPCMVKVEVTTEGEISIPKYMTIKIEGQPAQKLKASIEYVPCPGDV